MGPGLKKKSVSCSVTGTTAPLTTDATPGPQIGASTPSNTSPSTQTSGAGSSKVTRKRGRTRGIGVRKSIAQHGGNRLDVYVVQEMRAFCGINATKVASEFGVQIRSSIPIESFFKSWKHVDSGLKAAIFQAVRGKFRIHEDEDEFTELVDEVMNEKADTVYTEWKHEMGKHYRLANENYEKTKDARDHPYRYPFKGVNQDKWKYMVDHVFGDETWKADKANKNEEGLPLPLEERLPLVDRLPDFCDTCKVSHILKETQDWIDPICKEKYLQMVALRDEAIQSGTPLTAEGLSRAVLGERKNYIRGFGNGPKPSTYVSKSKSDLARQGQLQKVQAEMESLREEARLREEEQIRRYEQLQSNNEAMRRELDNMKKFMMQFQNCGQVTMGSM